MKAESKGKLMAFRRGTVALVVAFGLVAGCGGDGDDADAVEAWCGEVENMAQVLEEQADFDPQDMDELEARIDEFEALERDLRDAPGSIADEVAVIFDTDMDTLNLDEQEAVSDARETVNDYIREECRLDVGL